MPVKNAGLYLKPCLESIIAQSLSDWELIAINDGSTDGSKAILQEYADKYESIYTRDSRGNGILEALRTAYKLSSGDLIHRMDADDLMPLNKLEWMSAALKKGSLVTGMVSYFCDERELGEGFKKYTKWLNGLMEGGDFWRDVYRECPVPSSAWMMYRKDFERIGGFSSELMPEDYDLAFRMMKHNLEVIRLDEVVHHWRDSETRVSRNEEQYFPIAYLPLKVHYFLELHREESKELILWGAGKKGKLVAKELIASGVFFKWITNNPNKIGKEIYGVIVEDDKMNELSIKQLIIAISSPKDSEALKEILIQVREDDRTSNYWWFC